MAQQVRAAVALAILLAATASDNISESGDGGDQSEHGPSVQLVADLDEYYIRVASLVQVAATEALTEDRMELTISCGWSEESTEEMEFHKCSQSEWRDVMDIRCASGDEVVIKLKERDWHYHDIGELRLPKVRTWSIPVGTPVEISMPLDVTIGFADSLVNHVELCLSDVFVYVAGEATGRAMKLLAARAIKLSRKALRKIRDELSSAGGSELGEATMGWLLDALGYVDECWGAALPDASYALTLEFTASRPYPAAEPQPIKEGSQKFLEKVECVAGQESVGGLRLWHWALIAGGVLILCAACCCYHCVCKK